MLNSVTMSKVLQYAVLMGVLPVVAGVALHYFFEETNEIKKLVQDIERVYSQYSKAGSLTSYPVLGDPNAPVTIEIYSDFECPFCAQFAKKVMPRLIVDYVVPGKAKLVYKYFPLPFHPNARNAAYIAMCANTKGKFWHIHDKFYMNFNNLNNEILSKSALEVGLTGKDLEQCLSDPSILDSFIDSTMQVGIGSGIRGTPTLVINGKAVAGLAPYDEIKGLIEQNL